MKKLKNESMIEDGFLKVLEFLVDNRIELIKDLKKEFHKRIDKYNNTSGRYQITFKDHLVDSIKCRIREIMLENANINSEDSYIIQENDVAKLIIDSIIEEVMNE